MAERSPETRARIIAVPQEIASCADEIAALAEHVRGQLRSSVVGTQKPLCGVLQGSWRAVSPS
jgi:hypothetical protein